MAAGTFFSQAAARSWLVPLQPRRAMGREMMAGPRPQLSPYSCRPWACTDRHGLGEGSSLSFWDPRGALRLPQ